jgi:hypothetical protein
MKGFLGQNNKVWQSAQPALIGRLSIQGINQPVLMLRMNNRKRKLQSSGMKGQVI